MLWKRLADIYKTYMDRWNTDTVVSYVLMICGSICQQQRPPWLLIGWHILTYLQMLHGFKQNLSKI